MATDGSALTRVTHTDNVQEDRPSFSPDGSLIVCGGTDGQNEDLYVMNADGSSTQNITNTPDKNEGRPSVAPFGLSITFDADYNGNWEIYTAGLRTNELTDIRQVTDHPGFSSRLPAFDSSGAWILFRSAPTGGGAEASRIYAVGTAGGTDPVKLSTEYADWYPTSQYDGKWVVFVSDRDGNPEIYAMDLGFFCDEAH